jgi:hypothetical protein
MADTTVRVAEEQKDEINEIAKKIGDGASQKEAISYLLQLEKVKREQDNGRSIPRLDDINQFASRIIGIYTEMYLTMRDQEEVSQEAITNRKLEVEDLKARLFETKEELDKVQDEANRKINEIILSADKKIADTEEEFRRVNEQKDLEVSRIKGEAALSRETAEKELHQMELLVKESRESKDQSAKLVVLAQEMAENANIKAAANEELALKAKQYQEEMQEMKRELQQIKDEAEKKEQNFIREIEKLQLNAEIDKERAILETQRKMMDKETELRDKVSDLREQISELRSGK